MHLSTIVLRILSCTALLAALSACAGANKKGESGAYGADGDYVTGTPLPERQEGVSFMGSNVDRERFTPVFFGFDSVTIGGGERSKIQEVASFLEGSPSTIIIAGFTDERGTPEYNRGLGERRALAVRQALIAAGADATRLQTVSFGADMPSDPGSGEGAWARNRRAEFGLVR